MSHTTEIAEIVFTDIAALEAALAELTKQGVKATLEKGGTPRAFYENQQGLGPADYTIRLADAPYDVGLYQNAALKGYTARTDLFMGHVAKVLGAPITQGEKPEQAALGRLYQMYAIHATTRQAIKQGYTVQRHVKADGTVALQLNVR